MWWVIVVVGGGDGGDGGGVPLEGKSSNNPGLRPLNTSFICQGC